MPFSWDAVAERYAKARISDPAGYEAGLERVRSHLGPEMRVLEMGCGTGMTARKLAPSVAHLTGTDASAAMIGIARRTAAEEGPGNISFEVLPVGGPALAGEPFDAVLAFNLLHLVEDLGAALADMAGRVRPGGLIVSKTTCLSAMPVLRPVVAVMRLVGKAPPVLFLSADDLEEAHGRAGLEIVETRAQRSRPPRHLIVARRP